MPPASATGKKKARDESRTEPSSSSNADENYDEMLIAGRYKLGKVIGSG
ncbi:unnamed protein product, partial [Cyprideis torosa]